MTFCPLWDVWTVVAITFVVNNQFIHAARSQCCAHSINYGLTSIDVWDELWFSLRRIGPLLQDQDRGTLQKQNPFEVSKNSVWDRITSMSRLRFGKAEWCSPPIFPSFVPAVFFFFSSAGQVNSECAPQDKTGPTPVTVVGLVALWEMRPKCSQNVGQRSSRTIFTPKVVSKRDWIDFLVYKRPKWHQTVAHKRQCEQTWTRGLGPTNEEHSHF